MSICTSMSWRSTWRLGVVVGLFALGGAYLYVRTQTLTSHRFYGMTMGRVPYTIHYRALGPFVPQKQIDSLLSALNGDLSHYLPESELSRLNRSSRFQFEGSHVRAVLRASESLYARTEGYFDPALGAVSAHYGFGPQANPAAPTDPFEGAYGWASVVLSATGLSKPRATQIDLSAIAKGYVVDQVAAFLEAARIVHYMVEIGGEIRTKGYRKAHLPWRIGIAHPNPALEAKKGFVARLLLTEHALATSGNYRQRIPSPKGETYGHTLNPHTAQPAHNEWLSVSILAPDCMTADALATASMAMGKQKAIQLIQSMPHIELLALYRTPTGDTLTYLSPNLKSITQNLSYPVLENP